MIAAAFVVYPGAWIYVTLIRQNCMTERKRVEPRHHFRWRIREKHIHSQSVTYTATYFHIASMKSNHVIRALTLVCIVISIFSIDAADQDPGCSGVDMETCANAEDGGDDGTGLANEAEVTKELECVAGTEECAGPEAIASMEGSAGSDEGNPQHAAVSENPASPAGDNTVSAEKPESLGAGDPNCPDRDHLMRCAGKHLDHNKNGKLDRDELQGAIDSLPGR